jgi:hypothetical protein
MEASARIAEAHSELVQQRISLEIKHLSDAVEMGTEKIAFVLLPTKQSFYKEEFGEDMVAIPFTNDSTIAGIRRELFHRRGIATCKCYNLTLKDKVIRSGTVMEHDIYDGCTLRIVHSKGLCACRG